MVAKDGVRQETGEPDVTAEAGATAGTDAGQTAKSANDRGAERGGDGRYDVDLRTILSRLATQIADSDRRHGAALRDLQTRLGNMPEAGDAASGAQPDDCSHSFSRIELQLQELAGRLKETRDRLETAQFATHTSQTADVAQPETEDAPGSDFEPVPEFVSEDEPELVEASDVDPSASLNDIYASIKTALAAPVPAHDVAHEIETDVAVEEVSEDAVMIADDGESEPQSVALDVAADDVEAAAEAEAPVSKKRAKAEPVPFEGWNDDASWDEESAEALANVYAESDRISSMPLITMPKADVVVADPVSSDVEENITPAEPTESMGLATMPAAAVSIDETVLTERLDALAAEIERSLADAVPSGSIADLAQRMDELDAKIAELQVTGGGDDVIGAIEAHISDMLAQIDRIAAEAQRIEVIEDSISKLYDEVSNARADLPALVEQATQSAAQSFTSTAMSEDATQEKLDAMHELLVRLSETGQLGGSGEHAGLTAVNATLMELVQRIDELEAIAAGAGEYEYVEDGDYEPDPSDEAYAAPVQVMDDEPQEETDFAEQVADDEPDEPEAYEEQPEVAPQPMPKRRDTRGRVAGGASAAAQVAYAMEPEIDDEPEQQAQSDIQRVRRQMTARAAVAAQAEASRGGKAGDGDKRVRISGDDFLAAARRAAKSAHDAVAGGGDKDAGAAKAAARDPRSAVEKVREQQGQKKRSLFSLNRTSPTPVLVVAIVMLLAAGAGLVYAKLSKGNQSGTVSAQSNTPGESQPGNAGGGDTQLGQSDGDKESRFDAGNRFAEGSGETIDNTTHATHTPLGIVIDPAPYIVGTPSQDGGPAIAPATGTAALVSGISGVSVQSTAVRPADTSPVDELRLAEGALAAVKLPPEGSGSLEERLMAAEGDSGAQFSVASRLATGALGVRDEEQAVAWYQRAASSGYAPAQYRLGTHYERGRGIAKDPARARIWYDRAAKAGHVKAMHNLAVMLASGGEGEPNYVTAVQWFEKAADSGLSDSQFNLAILYQNGLGVARNYVEAYKWFSIAANGGDTSAARRRDALGGELSPEAVAQGTALANTWQPRAIDPAANRDDMVTAEGASADAGSNQSAPSRTASIATPTIAQPAAVRAPQPAVDQTVAEAQRLLSKLGFDPGPADGQMGQRTAAALRRFEAQAGLVPTGRMTAGILDRLRQAAG